MKEERDRFLTEAQGECWHEWNDKRICKCLKCKALWGEVASEMAGIHCYESLTPEFSEWDGFGVLWGWAKKQEWWGDEFQKCSSDMENPITYIYENLINPDYFADAVYKFLRERR